MPRLPRETRSQRSPTEYRQSSPRLPRQQDTVCSWRGRLAGYARRQPATACLCEVTGSTRSSRGSSAIPVSLHRRCQNALGDDIDRARHPIPRCRAHVPVVSEGADRTTLAVSQSRISRRRHFAFPMAGSTPISETTDPAFLAAGSPERGDTGPLTPS